MTEGECTAGERLVERLSITQAMLDDNERLRAEIARLRLSSAEREAIEVAAEAYADDCGERFASILRRLLERTK